MLQPDTDQAQADTALLVQLLLSIQLHKSAPEDAADAEFLQLDRQAHLDLMETQAKMALQATPERTVRQAPLHHHNANNIPDVKNARKLKLVRQANQARKDCPERPVHQEKLPMEASVARQDLQAPLERKDKMDIPARLDNQANQELFAPCQENQDPQDLPDLPENADPLDLPAGTENQDLPVPLARKATTAQTDQTANQDLRDRADHKETKVMEDHATTAHRQERRLVIELRIQVESIPSSLSMLPSFFLCFGWKRLLLEQGNGFRFQSIFGAKSIS
jgi:hypothetical protein